MSCVFLNAIKFTEEGKITLEAKLTSKAKAIVINIVDTGPGIEQDFLPYLFKPFSREDDSLTRRKEGLGLGLLVAKGVARKLGGDLICVRSDTTGPRRGSDFELRVPISYNEGYSRGSTPTGGTPTPSRHAASEPASKARARQTASADRRRTTPRTTQTPHPSRLSEPSFAKAASPLDTTSQSRRNSLSQSTPSRRPSTKHVQTFDRNLAKKHPLTFLIAEDNKINRKLLVNMLGKLGYNNVHEAYDGAEAVHQMSIDRAACGEKPIDVILMDLWMPNMDGYEATQRIFANERDQRQKALAKKSKSKSKSPQMKRSAGPNDDDDDDRTRRKGVTVLAVSADVTDSALERAKEVGMEGFMTKPYKILDLERLILEYCAGDGNDGS